MSVGSVPSVKAVLRKKSRMASRQSWCIGSLVCGDRCQAGARGPRLALLLHERECRLHDRQVVIRFLEQRAKPDLPLEADRGLTPHLVNIGVALRPPCQESDTQVNDPGHDDD